MMIDGWLNITSKDGLNFDLLKSRLEVPNPEYLSRQRMGLSVAGIARLDPLYQEVGNTLKIPRALVRRYGRGRAVEDNTIEGTSVDFNSKIVLGPNEHRMEDQTRFVEELTSAVLKRGGAIGQAAPGYGKAQSIESTLWTKDGPIKMGDVEVGTEIYGQNGKLTTVTGVFPQGVKDIYRITFTDGSTVDSDIDHLWTVQSSNDRRKNPNRWHTLELRHILEKGLYEENGKRVGWYIPMAEPVQFEKKEYEVDPYVVGCLIADGGFTTDSVIFSNSELDVKNKFEARLPDGCSLKTRVSGRGWCVAGFKPYARKLGLAGKYTYEKHIPVEYLYGSVEDRMQLLHGLFDCDGSVSNGGKTLEYTTTSKQLAEDVRTLVESLGGTARTVTRTTRYNYKGEALEGRLSYRITIVMPRGEVPFSSNKHRKRYTRDGTYNARRGIKSVELVGRGEMQCISVAAEDSLYLTDHFIVTHNTICGLETIARIGKTTAVIVHKSFLMNQWIERIVDCYDIPESEIGFVQQDRCEYEGKKIVLIMAQSLLAREYPRDLFTYFGTVVVDEVHRFGAVEFRKVITMFPARYRIGLTATPNRADGLEEVFFSHIGEIAVVGAKRRLVATVQTVRSTLHPTQAHFRQMKDFRGQFNLTKVVSYLVEHEGRNRMIVGLLIRALQSGRKVMVLSGRRGHLKDLERLVKVEMMKQKERFTIGYYVGGMEERDLTISATRDLLLATYQMASEGLDIPELDTLFLVTPRGDVEQAVGRILREAENKKEPMVIDIVDPQIPICVGLYRKRMSQYKETGSKII